MADVCSPSDAESDGTSKISDFSIRASLSRSSSLLEEEQTRSLSELQPLPDAMSNEDPSNADAFQHDSQVMIEDSYTQEESQVPLTQAAGGGDGEDSDVEMVVAKSVEPDASAEPDASVPEATSAMAPENINQLTVLLNLVKAKAAQVQKTAEGSSASGQKLDATAAAESGDPKASATGNAAADQVLREQQLALAKAKQRKRKLDEEGDEEEEEEEVPVKKRPAGKAKAKGKAKGKAKAKGRAKKAAKKPKAKASKKKAKEVEEEEEEEEEEPEEEDEEEEEEEKKVEPKPKAKGKKAESEDGSKDPVPGDGSKKTFAKRICSDCSREEVPRLQRFARCFLSSELISSWCGILEDTLHGLELRSFQVLMAGILASLGFHPGESPPRLARRGGLPVQLLDALFQFTLTEADISVESEAELLLEAMWRETPDLGDTWEDAKLRAVVKYLIGARGLDMASPQPMLRNGWSAATLLSGIQHMNMDCLQAIKKELPDDPDQLAKLCEVLSEMRGAALEKGPVAPVHPQRSNSTATTIPATEEELAALGRKARLTFASPEIPADAPPGGKAPRDIPADAPPGNAAAAKGTAGSPATPAPIPAPSHPAEGDGEGSPVILHIATMTRAEKEKVRRLVTPKPTTGNLSVPKDIFELWQTDKGREKLLCMWCKSGGVKAVFIQRVEFLSTTTKSKKIEVKGGFYSEEDMKERIEKIKKWATERKLVRICEYDETVIEYWVNTRTSGVLSREDLQRLSVSRSHEGEGELGGSDMQMFDSTMDAGGFDDLGRPGDVDLEGDTSLQAFPCKGKKGDLQLSSTVHHIAKMYAKGAPAIDCVKEAKAASKKDDCRTLQVIARAPLSSADEPLFRALRSSGLVMDFPISQLQLDNDFKYPVFPPREQLEASGSKGFLHKIIGIPIAYADTELTRFWGKYKRLCPQHDIFAEANLDFSHLIPYYLHGDGGRTYKKDPIMILSMFSAFGCGTARNPVELQPVPGQSRKRRFDHGDKFEPGVNLRGNTFTSRFLFAAMKAEFYKKKPGRFQSLLDQWGQLLGSLFHEGLSCNGENWKIAILGITGDAPFLREAGNHNRSFSNVRKSATARTMLPGVCWLCAAGKTNGPPFEDVRLSAQWTTTCGVSNILPWDQPGPLLQHVPVNDLDLAAFYRPDLFHVYFAGVGKDFTASALIYIAKTVFKQSKIQRSVESMNGEMRNFMKEEKERFNFGHFSLDLLGYASSRSFSKGHWSKNMDTATVSKFIEYICRKHIQDFPDDTILGEIFEACGAIHHFMSVVFAGSFFLSDMESWQMISAGHAFIAGYMNLAKKSLDAGYCLFALKPVVNLFAHIVHTALQQYKVDCASVVNPIAESTFMAEDLVGKISRLSRRVSARKHGEKIMYRYMVATHFHLNHPDGLQLDV
ncbi:unnamed protein product [Durusdinium trenchii]|uniref:Uncharacterized protein n=1 Tax=Durusdinium trenchii TaxID=1381693 RepID=A0ABP0P8M3_9DINO